MQAGLSDEESHQMYVEVLTFYVNPVFENDGTEVLWGEFCVSVVNTCLVGYFRFCFVLPSFGGWRESGCFAAIGW